MLAPDDGPKTPCRHPTSSRRHTEEILMNAQPGETRSEAFRWTLLATHESSRPVPQSHSPSDVRKGASGSSLAVPRPRRPGSLAPQYVEGADAQRWAASHDPPARQVRASRRPREPITSFGDPILDLITNEYAELEPGGQRLSIGSAEPHEPRYRAGRAEQREPRSQRQRGGVLSPSPRRDGSG